MWGLECDMQIQLSWFLAVYNKKRLNSGTAEIYRSFLFLKPFVCLTTTAKDQQSHHPGYASYCTLKPLQV